MSNVRVIENPMRSIILVFVALIAGHSPPGFARSCSYPGDLWFEFNASGLPAEERLKVVRLVEKAMHREGIPLIIAVGHTDVQEGNDTNQTKLSLQRAEAVREYIGRQWPALVKRTYIEWKASRQIMSTSDRAKNRRVELVVYCNDTAMPALSKKP